MIDWPIVGHCHDPKSILPRFFWPYVLHPVDSIIHIDSLNVCRASVSHYPFSELYAALHGNTGSTLALGDLRERNRTAHQR